MFQRTAAAATETETETPVVQFKPLLALHRTESTGSLSELLGERTLWETTKGHKRSLTTIAAGLRLPKLSPSATEGDTEVKVKGGQVRKRKLSQQEQQQRRGPLCLYQLDDGNEGNTNTNHRNRSKKTTIIRGLVVVPRANHVAEVFFQ